MKRIAMIAGPNGSGKTALALELVSKEREYDEFINADYHQEKNLTPCL